MHCALCLHRMRRYTLCPDCCCCIGAFFDYLDTEHPGRFDRIASGHYARVIREPLAAAALGDGRVDTAVSHAQAGVGAHMPAGSVNTDERVLSQQGAGPGPSSSSGGSGAASSGGSGGLARLALTPDAVKDQTYFLAHLSPAQLSRAIFPLGPLTKKQVRKEVPAAALCYYLLVVWVFAWQCQMCFDVYAAVSAAKSSREQLGG